MKKPSRITLAFLLLLAPTAYSAETIMCNGFYNNVSRKVAHIERLGTGLSKLAQDKLFEDLKIDLQLCISNCDSRKFNFCNDVAKSFESR